ncbi:MAG: hypothetical protein ACKVT0_05835 [Planctomycetaceae bacterium]
MLSRVGCAHHLAERIMENKMKNRMFPSLVILGVNVVVGVLALSAFYLYIFKGDPILAAVPAILALPAIVLQPWFILFFFLPYGPLVAPFLTTILSVLIYSVLDQKGKLDRIRLVLPRLKNRMTIACFGGLAACLFGIGFARYVDFPSIHQGIPEHLEYFLKDIEVSLDRPRYYCLGSFIDAEWLWQTELSEHDLLVLADKLGMHPIPIEQVGEDFRSMPPYWWQPVFSDHVRVLATNDFPMDGRGQDGWHALATWNPEDKILHMWIKDNF